jgi:hypothetical protein
VQGTKTFEEGKWRNSGEMVVEKRALCCVLKTRGGKRRMGGQVVGIVQFDAQPRSPESGGSGVEIHLL